MKQKMKRHTLKHLGEMRQKKRSETKEHGKEKRNTLLELVEIE